MKGIEKKDLICEPVRRPDGEILVIHRTSWMDWRDPEKTTDSITFSVVASFNYDPDEVTLLGNGSFQRGIDVLGRAYYLAPWDVLNVGERRLLNDEIRELKKIQE